MRIWEVFMNCLLAQITISYGRSIRSKDQTELTQYGDDMEVSPSNYYKNYEISHEDAGGSKKDEGHYASIKHKSGKGHKKKHSWNKKEKGSRHKDDNSKHEEEEGGHKKSNYDESDSHSEHHEESKKKKNGKNGHKKHHKNGTKVTGYSKKINKDEYHKEHKFYDEKHADGNHKVRQHYLGRFCINNMT